MRPVLAPPPPGPLSRADVPTFSVIVPTFESASTVGAAVASALAQTRPALEVIVCDDGSTDDVEGALAPVRDRICLVRKSNGGGASALNHGTHIAHGEFVAILDADDVYNSSRIEALGDLAAARHDLDIVTTDAYFEIDGEIVGRFNRTTPFVVNDQRVAILRSCFVGGWPAVRRERVLATGGWDESLRIGYDWDCWLRLILDGARAGLVDEPLMSYRLHPGSLTFDRIANLRARVQLLEKAQNHPTLTRRERRILRASVGWQRSRLLREIEETRPAGGRVTALARRRARIREIVAHARFAAPTVATRSTVEAWRLRLRSPRTYT
jgi:glycosyltransferase involved in cell wall biosynthesis